jgi:hypothetical protein
MAGLIFSEVMLFLAAALLGFAAGWRMYSVATGAKRAADERDNEDLRAALSDAQVRRARQP